MDKTKQLVADVVVMPEKMYLKPERVQEALLKLPSWRLRMDGPGIESIRLFKAPQTASSFASYSCRMASKMGQPLQVDLVGEQVTLVLPGHPVRGCTGGLTNVVFRAADLIGC
jgi:pterin-4a-carbinolamine dehydratase